MTAGAPASVPAPKPLVPVPCCGCGADDFDALLTVDADYEYLGVIDDAWARRPFRFVRCRSCRLVYLNPRPELDEIHHYYPQAYGCFAQCPPPGRLMAQLYRVMVWLKRREILPTLPDDGVLLDFGCGNGHWLHALRQGAKPGQRFIGVDPSEEPIRRLRALGVEAHVGTEEDLERLFEKESVNLILFNHVVEHVPDPKATLRLLSELLVPGGRILGVTPNIDAWDARLFGKYWAGWHPPRHFVLFDPPALARFAADVGLEFVSWASELEGANHWSVSVHTWLTEQGLRPSPGSYRLALYPLLLLAAIPVALFQKLVSRTSVFSFVLRKPGTTDG